MVDIILNDLHSTEAFGPRRGARGGNRRSTSPRRHQSPTPTRQQQQASATPTNPSPSRQQQQPVDDHVADLSTMDGYLSEVGCIRA